MSQSLQPGCLLNASRCPIRDPCFDRFGAPCFEQAIARRKALRLERNAVLAKPGCGAAEACCHISGSQEGSRWRSVSLGTALHSVSTEIAPRPPMRNALYVRRIAIMDPLRIDASAASGDTIAM
jgi:hypothetical protein